MDAALLFAVSMSVAGYHDTMTYVANYQGVDEKYELS